MIFGLRDLVNNSLSTAFKANILALLKANYLPTETNDGKTKYVLVSCLVK